MLGRLQQSIRRVVSNRHEPSDINVSFVVIVYDMPGQAANTIRSLLPDYQQHASITDYEVLIIENDSRNTIPGEFLATLPPNFRYYLRQESQPTPIYAINYGIERARGDNICVMIDGARLLTPGVINNVILGHQLAYPAVVTVPGYHLGFELQQKAVGSGYNVEQEQELMRSINWPQEGYRLFEIACFSGSCDPGFYLPHGESNCISMPRAVWKDLGGYDAQFDMRGGGLVNLDLYKRACEYPGVTHVFLHGEGTFHQFHGGVTTGGEEAEIRQKFVTAILNQYEQIRGKKFENPVTNPVYLGQLSDQVQKFVQLSSSRKIERLKNTAEAKRISA
jgi:glycosyltransferase involved in cell wall biosynthesis